MNCRAIGLNQMAYPWAGSDPKPFHFFHASAIRIIVACPLGVVVVEAVAQTKLRSYIMAGMFSHMANG